MKVIHRDRHQDDFDNKSRYEQCGHEPHGARQAPAIRAGHEALHYRPFVQRNNGGHRGKTQLEAWTRQRFRPKAQHEKRARRNHAQADRLSAQGHRDQDEQSGHAGADRGHFRPGQQRIADRCHCSRACRDERHRNTKRKRRDECQQTAHDQIDCADHGGHVQAADRKQVRHSAPSHRLRIGFIDGAPVARGERCAEGASPAPHLPTHMARQRGAPLRKQALLCAALQNFDVADDAASGAQTIEPGALCEVVSAGNGRAGWRHQARFRPDDSTLAHPLIIKRRRHVQPDLGRQSGRLGRTDRPTHDLPRRQLFCLDHLSHDRSEKRFCQRLRIFRAGLPGDIDRAEAQAQADDGHCGADPAVETEAVSQ